MKRLNRDTYVAAALLVISGVFFWASFDIRQPDYGVLMPSTWPRIIIGVLAFLSMIFLIQSVGATPSATEEADPDRRPGIGGFFAYWRNPIICFATFFGFLATLPVLGMLIGGISFVFTLLTLLGGWQRRDLMVHAAIAVLTVGTMWSIFTFGLGVILPTGIIYNPFG